MDRYLAHLAKANETFGDQIKIADQKAAYIFTFMLALTVSSTEARQAFSLVHLQAASFLVGFSSLLLVVAIGVTLGTAICVVLPRSRPGRSVLFWGAWPDAGDRLMTARAVDDEEFLLQDLLQNTNTLAAIAAAKHRLIFIAFRSLLLTVAAYALQLAVA